MEVVHNKQWQFLDDELRAETEVFKRKFTTVASTLLLEQEEMYVGQFLGFKNGELLINFPNTRSVPRRGEVLYCMLLPQELRLYKNWGRLTYEDLYSRRFKGTETTCLWQGKSSDSRCTLVGFGEIDLEFFEMIQDTPGLLLVFAPQRPPIEYLANLQKIVENDTDRDVFAILNPERAKHVWEPKLIQDDAFSFIYQRMQEEDNVVLQGPPGTGKTYLIAQLCKRFAAEGKSILVTALTNRALMEVAEKESMDALLSNGRVSKTNLTTTERHENPRLQPNKEISANPSHVVLATYFKSSGYAIGLNDESKFDVVIMDEASQAFAATFAAVNKLGRKTLCVGDTKQMAPVYQLNDDIVKRKDYLPLIEGMQYVADRHSSPIYQLTSTRRFGSCAAGFTGLFYDGTLNSIVTNQAITVPEGYENVLSPLGGPALIKMPLETGDLAPRDAINKALELVHAFLRCDKEKKIAVLAHQVKTVKALQRELSITGLESKNVFADTVARVQGLTTDIVIYVIANSSYIFSLERRLFNVATSRSREHTILIADYNIVNDCPDMNVAEYLGRL